MLLARQFLASLAWLKVIMCRGASFSFVICVVIDEDVAGVAAALRLAWRLVERPAPQPAASSSSSSSAEATQGPDLEAGNDSPQLKAPQRRKAAYQT
jgi:hypothetical protein